MSRRWKWTFAVMIFIILWTSVWTCVSSKVHGQGIILGDTVYAMIDDGVRGGLSVGRVLKLKAPNEIIIVSNDSATRFSIYRNGKLALRMRNDETDSRMKTRCEKPLKRLGRGLELVFAFRRPDGVLVFGLNYYFRGCPAKSSS